MELPPVADHSCPVAAEIRPWQGAAAAAALIPPAAPSSAAALSKGDDYRDRLHPTPAGWPIRSHWCVWLEPVEELGPTGIWEQRWHHAVQQALASWRELIPITLVDQPEQAHVVVERRRPPLRNNRASHGRAELQLLEVQRGQGWELEPQVRVMISPGQAAPAMQATALHELGHAFGLWGHSSESGDALAVKPGAKPVLSLSERDRRTILWLQQQPAVGAWSAP